MSEFIDVTLSGIFNAFAQAEKAKAEVDIAKYNAKASTQQAALHASETADEFEAANEVEASSADYFDRMPKPLLYGSIAMLVLGVGLAVRG